MAKNVFDPREIKNKDGKFQLGLVHEYYVPEEKVEVEEVPQYTGPTVEELQKQADDWKANWEVQKQEMLKKAQDSADEIVKKAEDSAFAEVKRQSDQAQIIRNDAEKAAAETVKHAQEEARKIIEEAQAEHDKIKDGAYKEGFEKGHEDGYQDGSAEVTRLIERTHKLLESVMSRREEILNETEQQIVDLVILMTRKVVKIISENQKSVVMANIIQALKKVKGRGNVTLRVNLADVKLTTEHIQDFISQVENIKGINVLEDSTVEKGGCVVETDFGAIDARISSQLTELENKILEISPVKTNVKTGE